MFEIHSKTKIIYGTVRAFKGKSFFFLAFAHKRSKKAKQIVWNFE